MTRLNKIPSYCANPSKMQAGDILIFDVNAFQRKNLSGWTTIVNQALMNEKGGHKETGHVGVVVELNGKKMLAHMTRHGFLLGDLDYIRTTTHVYRPRKHAIALGNEINNIIKAGVENNTFEKFSLWQAVLSTIAFIRGLLFSLGLKKKNPLAKTPSSSQPISENNLSQRTLCTKFVVQVYQTACQRLTKASGDQIDFASKYMNIHSSIVIKPLQAYLYRNPNFETLVMPAYRGTVSQNGELQSVDRGADLVQELTATIKLEYWRLLQSKNKKAIKKGEKLKNILNEHVPNAEEDALQQAMSLLKRMIPVLKINTGHHLVTPTSYKNVMSYAHKQGIYTAYLKEENDSNKKLSEVAEKQYHFPPCLAKLYSKYRKLGFSDEQARFECAENPTLLDWLKLNPGRNSVAGLTVFPFLFGSVPYGLKRVAEVSARNKALIAEAQPQKTYSTSI